MSLFKEIDAEILLIAERRREAENKRLQDACDHGDMDGGQCLECGLDRTEELCSLAHDRAKDRIKYGV